MKREFSVFISSTSRSFLFPIFSLKSSPSFSRSRLCKARLFKFSVKNLSSAIRSEKQYFSGFFVKSFSFISSSFSSLSKFRHRQPGEMHNSFKARNYLFTKKFSRSLTQEIVTSAGIWKGFTPSYFLIFLKNKLFLTISAFLWKVSEAYIPLLERTLIIRIAFKGSK